jgi:16S rRNA (guanine966-N2)-methyltransferase
LTLKIVGGERRGLKLFLPRDPDFRPTSQMVREAIFNMIGDAPVGASVLDLYAGSGAMGLEARSRGAERVLFCDRSPKSLAVLKKNSALFDEPEKLRILRAEFPKNHDLLKSRAPFDLVFLDPPYAETKEPLNFLKIAAEKKLVVPGAVLVWETGAAHLREIRKNDFSPWRTVKTGVWGSKGALILELGKAP